MTKTDSELQHDILAELDWEPSLDAAHVGVSVDHGVVTLTGFVSHYAEKMSAEKAARRVGGVRAIAEEIEVRCPTDAKTADHEIARRIADVFSWDVLVPDSGIEITVERGWVTLCGEVDWSYQRDEAKRDAGRIGGVVGITDLLEIRIHPVAVDVKERIRAAFRRHAGLDAERITVHTEGGVVQLLGRVADYGERALAEKTARAAAGVTDVRNEILVEV